MSENKPQVIAIGASAGGVTAVQKIISKLDPNFLTPIVVVLHISPGSRPELSKIYSAPSGNQTSEIEDKMPLQKGRIYFASPDYHLMLESDLTFSLSQDEQVHFSRPSIDVFFESVANAVGAGAVGILLTGANSDGASGLKKISEMGGLTIVQNPQDAECPYMPQAALNLLKPSLVCNLAEIPQHLNRVVREAS